MVFDVARNVQTIPIVPDSTIQHTCAGKRGAIMQAGMPDVTALTNPLPSLLVVLPPQKYFPNKEDHVSTKVVFSPWHRHTWCAQIL